MTSQKRLLLVEDDRKIVELLTWHFEREEFEVISTHDGEEAILIARETHLDLVLLDWMIEGVSGLEVCRRLRRLRETANVPIIMLTARGEELDRIRGLEMGADDYVTKPFSPRELVARVHAVMRRVRPALAGKVISYADLELNVTSHKVKRGGVTLQIGPTEYRLLKHFMEHPTRVFSRERLLIAVWGHDTEIDSRTVDVHIRRLRTTLEQVKGPELIRTVRGAGYALDSDN